MKLFKTLKCIICGGRFFANKNERREVCVSCIKDLRNDNEEKIMKRTEG